ncbi:hypothetical protein ACFW4X_19185 [Streptomyces smyrnaeus]|uniref:hypothetical protein n=1 Tax=Streptomyces smyrnaeus TaxID=1387713 RepID=UPI0036AA21AB
MDPELLKRITARRVELDEREELLARELAEVRAERDERDEFAVAERVLDGRRPDRFTARQVGDALGIDVSVRSKLEPLRGKLVRLVDRGLQRKLPDGRFTTRL